MRVGIVGFGKMGMLHGALLSSQENVEVVSIVDKSKLVLRSFKSVLPHVKFYTTYEKMLNECELDAIIIATPSFNHIEIAKLAVNKNIHVFVEKPLSSNLKEAIELYELVKNGNNLVVMVGFCLRYIPTFSRGKEIIKSNQLGKIKTIDSKMYIADVFSEQKGWRYNKEISGGGVLIDFGIHMIDLLCWIFGEVDLVNGTTQSIYSTNVEDEVQATINFKNGLIASLDSSWSKEEYRKSYAKIEISFENGTMEINDQNIIINDYSQNEQYRYSYPDLYMGQYIDIGGPNYSVQMKLFIDHINSRTQPEANIKNSVHVQKVVDAIYRSAKLKTPMKII